MKIPTKSMTVEIDLSKKVSNVARLVIESASGIRMFRASRVIVKAKMPLVMRSRLTLLIGSFIAIVFVP